MGRSLAFYTTAVSFKWFCVSYYIYIKPRLLGGECSHMLSFIVKICSSFLVYLYLLLLCNTYNGLRVMNEYA